MSEGFDPHMPQRSSRDGWRWLAGRAGRGEYWLWIGITFGLSIVLGFVVKTGAGALTAILLLAQIRRLHDLGRTGWWAVAATLAPVAVMVPVWLLTSIDVGLLAGVVVELALIVWIGVMRGDAAANRFGDPPPRTWARAPSGR
jgi:uncharacterized membrane protein YhaH (DUF805 family)